MIGKLVLENVRHRPLRTLLSILLVGVPVALILILVGLSNGIVNDSKRRASGVGAAIILRAPGSSVMAISGTTIPEQLVGKLATWPHVTMAMGTVNQGVGGLLENATGIDPQAFSRMSGGFDFVEGHGFLTPFDIIVDTYYAEQKKIHAGSKLVLMGREWTVAGVVEPGKLSHIFVQMNVLQDLIGAKGLVSNVYLKVDYPSNIQSVIDSLHAKFVDYPIVSMRDLIELTSVDRVPALNTFIDVIIGIGVVISFAVVSLSMYMAILQRTREIGILKAIGASKGFILRIIMAEALIMGFGGTVLGILFSFGSRWLLAKFVPSSLPQAIVPNWWLIAGGIVMGAALLGALYPGVTAAQQDPIDALAYE